MGNTGVFKLQGRILFCSKWINLSVGFTYKKKVKVPVNQMAFEFICRMNAHLLVNRCSRHLTGAGHILFDVMTADEATGGRQRCLPSQLHPFPLCAWPPHPHKKRSTPEFTLIHLSGITRGYLLNKMTEAPSHLGLLISSPKYKPKRTILSCLHSILQVDSDSSTDPFSSSKISSLLLWLLHWSNLQRLQLLLQWTVTLLLGWGIFPRVKALFLPLLAGFLRF